MGKVTGFMEYPRLEEEYLPVEQRVKEYREFVLTLDDNIHSFTHTVPPAFPNVTVMLVPSGAGRVTLLVLPPLILEPAGAVH